MTCADGEGDGVLETVPLDGRFVRRCGTWGLEVARDLVGVGDAKRNGDSSGDLDVSAAAFLSCQLTGTPLPKRTAYVGHDMEPQRYRIHLHHILLGSSFPIASFSLAFYTTNFRIQPLAHRKHRVRSKCLPPIDVFYHRRG